MLMEQPVLANKFVGSDGGKIEDSTQRAWASPERAIISFSPPPPGPTVAERIDSSPYIKTDVFRRPSAISQALKSHHKQGLSDHELEGRSKTLLTLSPSTDRKHRKLNSLNVNLERLHQAKDAAEKAIKAKKIFTIQGPYYHVREALRRRGWIEKFYKMDAPTKKSPRTKKTKPGGGVVVSDDSDADDYDDDGVDDDDDAIKEDENIPKPWEEDNGIYGIMSRMAKNYAPQFIWCIRRDAVDFRYLRRDQMVNHYGHNGAFTTKVGLCTNLRSSHWYENVGHETFFPRCYRLSHEEEKGAFIDDYYLSACMSIVRWVIMRNRENFNSDVPSEDEEEVVKPPATAFKSDEDPHTNLTTEKSTLSNGVKKDNNSSVDNNESRDSLPQLVLPAVSNKDGKTPRKDVEPGISLSFNNGDSVELSDDEEKKPKKAPRLPMSLLDTALLQCEQFLNFYDNEELEDINVREMLDIDWDAFLQQYYLLCHNKGIIPGTSSRLDECEKIVNQLQRHWPQFDLDGIKNLWIVKPGAKSRGRGIVCYDKLHDMLKLVDSVVRKDSKFVVQKYIERPLLIYETKFDIRQWFLVTDWNPLTIWWYKDFYVRFCKKVFSLDELDEVIHLSNNSIQKNYVIDPNRSKKIPNDSMWASDDEFQDFLEKRGAAHHLEERIKLGMQQAVICSLLTTRDIIEYRKSSFELYGADFMLTEDYRPWLLEINASPTLSPSTHVTKRMCQNVVEDTIKVVIDRKLDKNCDTGNFECIYKTNMVAVPQYLGMNLAIEGTALKTPHVQPVAPRPRRIVVPETAYQSIAPKADVCPITTKKEKLEKKRKASIKMAHRDTTVATDSGKGTKTPPGQLAKTPTLETISETKSVSEPSSAKVERSEGLLLKRKRNSSKSVEIPKSQLDLMKPTDSYLRKIKEGIDNARKMLKVEPGATIEKSFCPKCGGNSIIRLANDCDPCSCKQDCIQTTDKQQLVLNPDTLPYQIRTGGTVTSSSGTFNQSARSRVLKVMEKDSSAQLIVPFAPRKLVIKAPEGLPLVASGNMHRFLKVTPGPDTLPYRKAKKQYNRSYKLQKSHPDQTMFVLAESYSTNR